MISQPKIEKKTPSSCVKFFIVVVSILLLETICQAKELFLAESDNQLQKRNEQSTVEALVTQLSLTMFPTSTPTIMPVIDPTSTPIIFPTLSSENQTVYIPGITTGEITENLKKKKLICNPIQAFESGDYSHYCHLDSPSLQIRVDMLGKNPIMVDSIDACIMLSSSSQRNTAIEFLGYMATLPYTDSDPEKASTWVYTTIPTLQGQGDIRELIIGKVKFTLYGVSTAYTLLMEVTKN